jgi:hypothetical protein
MSKDEFIYPLYPLAVQVILKGNFPELNIALLLYNAY